MAFASRIGNALRRTSVPSNSSLLQLVRCMSSSKLFVAGLSYATDETTMKDAFSPYGNVLEASVIVNRDSGKSKGYGFITYTSSEEAAAAITAMDGKDLQGRIVRVSYANDRAGGIRRGGDFSNGGYGSGGHGSGGWYGSAQYGSRGSGAYGGSGRGHGGAQCGSSGGGYGGYTEGAGGGEDFSMNSNAGGGGYSSGRSYNTSCNYGGDSAGYGVTGRYNPPSTYGGSNGAVGGSGGDFSGGNFGVAGSNNGSDFARNVAGRSSGNGSFKAGGFGNHDAAGFETSQVKYNGQDDLLGVDFFADLEDGQASSRS